MQIQSLDYSVIEREFVDKKQLYLDYLYILIHSFEKNSLVISQIAEEIKDSTLKLTNQELARFLTASFHKIHESIDATAEAIIAHIPTIHLLGEEILDAVINLAERYIGASDGSDLLFGLMKPIDNIKEGMSYFAAAYNTMSTCLHKLKAIPQLTAAVEKMESALAALRFRTEKLTLSTGKVELQLRQLISDEYNYTC